MKLIFDKKEFYVISCFYKYEDSLIVDADFKENIDFFLKFIEEHSVSNEIFDFSINEIKYSGYFGSYKFDKTGKIRFCLTVYDEDMDSYVAHGFSGVNIRKAIESNRSILKEISLKVFGEDRTDELFTRDIDYCINYPSFYVDDLPKALLEAGEIPFGKLE